MCFAVCEGVVTESVRNEENGKVTLCNEKWPRRAILCDVDLYFDLSSINWRISRAHVWQRSYASLVRCQL